MSLIKQIITTLKATSTTLILGAVLFTPTLAQAQSVTPITRELSEIPDNRTRPFTVFFEYGFEDNATNLSNMVATATIINTSNPSNPPAFEFVADEDNMNYDIFNGDPANDSSTIPRSPSECQTFDAPRYEIPASFFTTTRMERYGLQTAKNGAKETAILTQKHTGCIAYQVRVASGAQVGDQARIEFDWDTDLSPDLSAGEKPPVVIQPLVVIEGNVSSVSSSSSSVSSISSVSSSSSSSSSVVVIQEEAPRTGAGSFLAISSLVLVGIVAGLYMRSRKTIDIE